MSFEDTLSAKMRSAAERMPARPVDVESFVARGRRSLRLQRFGVAAAVAVLGAGGFAVADRVLFNERAGEVLPIEQPGPDGWDATEHYDEIRERSLRFSELLDSGDARAAWDMLSRRAQVASGGYDAWERALPNTRALFTWMGDDTAFYFSPSISLEDRSIVTVTAAAPTGEDGSGLLTTFPVRVAGNDVLIDFDTERRLSLEPLEPLFVAGCASAGGISPDDPSVEGEDGCGNPADFRPTISDGMTFSVSVGPSEHVRQVMFAVGGDSALLLGEQSPPDADDMVRAAAFFPGAEAARETVFTVVIEAPDGEVEAYGYRVLYEGGA